MGQLNQLQQLDQLQQLQGKPVAAIQGVTRVQDVDAQTIEEYLELEKLIAQAEHTSPALVLQQKQNQKAHLEERIKLQTRNYKALQEQTELLRHSEDLLGILGDQVLEEEVKQRLLALGEDRVDEKREAVAAFNNKEIAKAELDNLEEQLAALTKDLADFDGQAKDLQALYTKQDELLGRIFGGDYGSLEENQYEQELDQHEEMRNRIVEANFKWKQSQLMVDYAYKQLKEAVKQWTLLPSIDASKLEERYSVAAIARNNLVAGAQNIQGAQRYLSNVQFPYCAPSEVATLNKATAYIFTDMQTAERHQHALDCYSTTSKRCGALLQWINQVVQNTIAKDLNDINKKVKDSSMSLRQERVRLIKVKAKELTGQDLDITVSDIDTDITVMPNINELALTEGIDPSLLATLNAIDMDALKAISVDELAPPPSEEDIFGKADELKDQYKEEAEKIIKQSEENKMRVVDSLQQKLQARKQRRARKNVEEKEREEYLE